MFAFFFLLVHIPGKRVCFRHTAEIVSVAPYRTQTCGMHQLLHIGGKHLECIHYLIINRVVADDEHHLQWELIATIHV